MITKPMTRRRLLAALKQQDETEVTDILTRLYQELGEERFLKILLDLWKHQPDAMARFARRSDQAAPALFDGALAQLQTLIKDLGPKKSVSAPNVKRLLQMRSRKQTAWVLQSEAYRRPNPHDLEGPSSDQKTWYEKDALARLDQVDLCALTELWQLSLENGLDEATVRDVRVVVRRWRAIADHLETLDQHP